MEKHKKNMRNLNTSFVMLYMNKLCKTLMLKNKQLQCLSQKNDYRSYVRFCVLRKDLMKMMKIYSIFIDEYVNMKKCQTLQNMKTIHKSMSYVSKKERHYHCREVGNIKKN